jgi:hypothetical protein
MLTQPYLSFLLKKIWGDYRYTMLRVLSLTKWFFIQIEIIHDNISSQVVDKRRYGFGKWMNSSVIHNNICSLSHKKCHPKNYSSGIKYHVTLNNIYSVVCTLSLLFKVVLTPELVMKTLNWSTWGHSRWVGNKHIDGHTFMLDGWEVHLFTINSSLRPSIHTHLFEPGPHNSYRG